MSAPERPVRRCFFALWPTAEIAQRLHQEAVKRSALCGGRIMHRDTLHLTLAFLGDIPAARVADAMACAAQVRCAPFQFQVDRLGFWHSGRREEGMLWAGPVSPPLSFLAQQLAGMLRAGGFQLDERPFAAHITLLRNARCVALPTLTDSPVWHATDFVLAESRRSEQGAHYEMMGRWPLKA